MFKTTWLGIVIVFFFISSAGYAQDKTIESINKILANPKISDTVRINTILDGMDNSVTWSKQHIAYYNQLPPIFSKGLKLTNLNPKVKLKYLDAAGVYYYNVAKKGILDGDTKAPEHFDLAIKYWKETKDYKTMAMAIVGKGVYYRKIADWPKTFENFFSALKYYESLKSKMEISQVEMEIGTTCLAQRDWEKAIVYLKKSLTYYDVPASQLSIGDRHDIAVLNNNLGVAYTQLKKLSEAHNSYLKAYEVIKSNNDPQSESLILVQLANSSNDMGDSAQAQIYLDQAFALCKDDLSRQGVYASAARIYNKSKKYTKAAEYAEMSYALAVKLKNIDVRTAMSNLLYRAYKQSGQYDKALKMYEAWIVLKDSSNTEASKNQLAQQQLKYDFERKELQQKILQQQKLTAVKLEQQNKLAAIKLENEKKSAQETSRNKLAQQKLKYDFEKKTLNQKLVQGKKVAAIKLEGEKKTAIKNNWLIGLSGALLLFLLGGYFYYRNTKQKQAITILEKDQIKQKLLVTQMNPHFIFNSIDNIQGLIQDKQDKEAVDYLSKFSKLTRQILENSNENYISLAEEVEMTQNYLAIQQLLYNNKFSYTISIEDAIDSETIFLPPMLTQPFIENAIKHGLSNKSEEGMITIHFYLKESKLFFEVTDNGKGFETDKKTTNHKSLAMTITKERLIGYTKNQDFLVQTDNILDQHTNIVGAKVFFEIPYIYEN
ncbi:tetratricopeptide repeat protein [Flavobacterium supellecticarium]|uniref:Tetratricopeptide repeat protein n=1 Tax=Flavobacterium supellecticarium TaxID=2565924 RepID=A0A4S3ZX77_9FLAO|nr:histidine kinase [Flavobacterium supellecticarium]THF50421.1 tetratricopeptide repeat protein [Flavobacterium supellecticarium]